MRPVGRPQSALRCPLNQVLGVEANVRVLRVLVGAEAALTRREVADAAGLSIRGATIALARLCEAGVVEVEGASRGQRYGLRGRHPLSAALRDMFEAEGQRLERMLRALRALLGSIDAGPACAWIDGPLARGSDTLNQALTLYVLAPVRAVESLRAALTEGVAIVEHESDVMIGLLIVTRADLEAGAVELASDSIIGVFGPAPHLLLSTAPPHPGRGALEARTHQEIDAEMRRLGSALARLVREDPSVLRAVAKRLRNQPLGAAHLAERCSLRPRATLTDAGNHSN